jgi:hypothetical protein
MADVGVVQRLLNKHRKQSERQVTPGHEQQLVSGEDAETIRLGSRCAEKVDYGRTMMVQRCHYMGMR